MVEAFYKTEGCKLYYGFLKEHMNPMVRIISADIAARGKLSAFAPALEDPVSNMLSNEVIDEHLLMPYAHRHKNSVAGNLLPETNKYPPSNEMMFKTPPTMREWKLKHQQGNMNPMASIMNLLHHQPIENAPDNANQSDEIVAITFCDGKKKTQ